jgi:hypothetical protein
MTPKLIPDVHLAALRETHYSVAFPERKTECGLKIAKKLFILIKHNEMLTMDDCSVKATSN